MQLQYSIAQAPCVFNQCIWYVKDEDTYIIGMECLTCRFFAKHNNRVYKND